MDWTAGLATVAVLPGEVTAPGSWTSAPALNSLGTIVHLAALVRHSRRAADEVYRTNVDGTLAMVRLAARHRCRLVFVSTAGTVGCFRRPDQTADEEAPWCEAAVRRWPYYHSKIVAEREGRRLAAELGVELVVVRPPVLLGPGDHRFRSTGHLIRYLRGRLPFLVHGGFHFVDVREAAAALTVLAGRADARPVYHFAGTSTTIERFFELAEEVSGAPAPKRILPFPLAWTLATLLSPFGLVPDPVVVEMASRYWGISSRYAESDLGYHHRDPHETLADTIAWLRAHHPALQGR
jgi:nucleoside-diphosphate-sugar epimerase